MDQDSTNGSAPDKRNWRERLGIGAKEMPKLSDEFREEPAKEQTADAEAPKSAQRPAQPVTRPAPMAPRAPRAAAATAAPAAPAPAAPPAGAAAPAPAAARATPRVPDNAAQEALAEKLRAQRAAAEKLAEQRVQAARERAEGKSGTAEPSPAVPKPAAPAPAAPAAARPAAPPAAPAPAPRARAAVPPPPPGARPKFSFAEEPPPSRVPPEAPAPRAAMSPGVSAPLTPPRPALGGERGQPPFLRPAAPGLGARPQPTYRPVDPNAGYTAAPRLKSPPAPRAGYNGEVAAPPPAYPGARGSAVRRPPAVETYSRPPEPRDIDEEQEGARPVPRLGRPGPAARGRAPQDEFDEVFEDDLSAAPRQRASARDYQSAYGEGEDAFGEDQRRSSGPWLLLLALLAAGLVVGFGIWYYNTNMKDVAATGGSSGDVPVVSAPEDPAKVAPDAPASGTEAPAAKKKQIYDRIVGEQEVIGGQVQSTEEIPVQPAAAQPANEVPAVEPAAGTQIPAPDAASQDTGVDGLPSVDEPPPLPVPPAGSDQQGSLDQKGIERMAAASAEPEQGATAPPAPPAAPSSSSVAALPPPPEKATDGAALVSQVASGSNLVAPPPKPATETASPPAAPAPKPKAVAMAEPEPAPEAAPPPTKKPVAKPKPPEKPAVENLGAEPVVLVPPAKVAPPQPQTMASTPAAVPEQAAPAQPAEKKRRTIMDLFRGDEAQPAEPATQVAAAQPQPESQQTRQAAQPPKQQGEPQPSTGTGFVIQLASFRSETEARQEYGRLSSLYPTVVGGLPQQIRQTNVGGSTRYQLGLGPLPSRSDATRVCSALITAGESDCIVRGL